MITASGNEATFLHGTSDGVLCFMLSVLCIGLAIWHSDASTVSGIRLVLKGHDSWQARASQECNCKKSTITVGTWVELGELGRLEEGNGLGLAAPLERGRGGAGAVAAGGCSHLDTTSFVSSLFSVSISLYILSMSFYIYGVQNRIWIHLNYHTTQAHDINSNQRMHWFRYMLN